MVKLAEEDANRAVKRVLREQGMMTTEKTENQSEV